MKALVVDDHRDVAEFVAEALIEMEGMEVDIATSSESAKVYSGSRQYDLFIVDLYLRGTEQDPDGLEFAKHVLAADPRAPIILMTGKSYSRIITDVIVRTGTTHLISKPIDLTTLVETVRKVLPESPEGDR